MVTMVIMGADGDDGAVGDFCGGNDGSSGANGICRTSLRQKPKTPFQPSCTTFPLSRCSGKQKDRTGNLETWRPPENLFPGTAEPRNRGPMQAPQTPMEIKNVSGNQKTPTGTEKPNPGRETHGNRKYSFGN